MLRNETLALIVRIALGAVFVYASLDKIANPEGFARAINNYHILPNDIISIFALILPWVELLCGIALIFGVATRASAIIVTGMVVMFSVAIVSALARGLSIDCGCFSVSAKSRQLGYTTLFGDIGLLILSIYIWWAGAGRWALARQAPAV